jgi:DNA polymerase III alpha subunit
LTVFRLTQHEEKVVDRVAKLIKTDRNTALKRIMEKEIDSLESMLDNGSELDLTELYS